MLNQDKFSQQRFTHFSHRGAPQERARIGLRAFHFLMILCIAFTWCSCVEPTASSAPNIINPGMGGSIAGEMISAGEMEGGDRPGPSQFEGRPSLMRIGDKVAVVGELLSIQLSASDPQNDILSFSLRSALPDGAKFEKEIGLFTWTPKPDQVSRSFLLTFEVSDGMLKDQETIAVRVSAAGSQESFPPSIDPISDQLLTVGQPWTYQLVGEDPNGQPLVYRLDGPIPLGLTFDATTGVAQWTPMPADVGRFDLRAGVSDGEAEATTPMRLIVRDANDQNSTNTPPVFVRCVVSVVLRWLFRSSISIAPRRAVPFAPQALP